MIPGSTTRVENASLSGIASKLRKLADALDIVSQEDNPDNDRPLLTADHLFALPNQAEPTSLWKPRAPLPDPRLLRKILNRRRQRARFFNPELFADPAWDMLLELAAARTEHRRISVTSLCIASSVPTTTALRWIKVLIDEQLAWRSDDDKDRRRAFISLTDKGADLIARYFDEMRDEFTMSR